MVRDPLTYDRRSLYIDYLELREDIDDHCGSFTDDEAWLIWEKLFKFHAFTQVMCMRFPDNVADASDEMAELAFDLMCLWSDSVSPIGGWPDSLLRRLR